MTQLAIIGHKTRGKEVIELLEMFGYVNYHKYSADCDSLCFYGGENTSTIYYDWVNNCEDMRIFTLEEFLEKCPYKLNELVLCDDGLLGIITKMEWDCEKSDMKYHISFNISDYNKWYNSKNIKCKFMDEKDMINIAIKGHKTRYKELIEILEMMGGINKWEYVGDRDCVYYINEHHTINYTSIEGKDFKIFTLEEFLEKYPYKVGDKVIVKGLSEYPKIINFMKWFDGDIHYSFDNETWFLPSALNLYKEEPMEVKRIAIVGHKTRGKEVIEILEMLGGINTYKYSGENEEICFAIGGATKMIYYDWISDCYGDESGLVFTLEEFLEKFPYKIGDKVQHKGSTSCDSVYEVEKMQWVNNHVEYTIKNLWYNNCYYVITAEDLQPYKEEEITGETMETITIDDFKANTKEWLIDKLHNMVISKAIKTISDIHEELHKPQYPKTYDECVDMFNCTVETVNLETLKALRELIYCRNAYWKIAGEQMGLGKPWKPDWNSGDQERYGIIKLDDNGYQYTESTSFVFPTEEMRDEFYKNFKELIEICKEFL